MEYISQYHSPLGEITLASDGEHLTGLWFAGQKYFAATLPSAHEEGRLEIFEQTGAWLDRYFAGQDPGPCVPLRPAGSPFRQRVWEILKKVPYGRLTTYGEMAAQMEVRSAQAVGGAVAHNPISILIPCHRVVGSGGSLTGYAGGIEKKVALLTLEGVDLTRLSRP